MDLEKFVERFDDPRRSGKGYLVQCPSHQDDKASLSVAAGTDGKIILKCFAGCSFEQITEAGKIDPRELFNNGSGEPDRVVKTYSYVDENGLELYRVSRTASKRFFQERFENGRYVPGLNGVRRVPYRLPEVIKSSWVCIAEGEKDC